MLVLSRKEGERIVIAVPPSGSETLVAVQVCKVRGETRVRLGFEAPREVAILREEIWQAMQDGKAVREAAEKGKLTEAEEALDYRDNQATPLGGKP